MRKAKSRNFILLVCGFFIIILVFFTMRSFINTFNKSEEEEKVKCYVESISSNVKLSGKGNFFGYTPKISDSSIQDYGVLLKEKGDSVLYSVTFCNNNDVKLKYKGIDIDNKLCTNSLGENSCDKVAFSSFVTFDDMELMKDSVISPKKCIDLVLISTFDSDYSENIYISIDSVTINFDAY